MKDSNALCYNNLPDTFKEPVRLLMKEATEDSEVGGHIKGLVATIISTEQKYELAIEVALGASIQHIVIDSFEDAKFLIEVMKRKHFGCVTFLPVASMKSKENTPEILEAKNEVGVLGLATELVSYDKHFEPVVGNLLGNTLVCDNITTAISIAEKYPHAFRIVTLEGDSISMNGAINGGFRKEGVLHLLSHKNND